MFYEENLTSNLLSFCPSTYVHPNPASHEPAYLQGMFQIDRIFSPNFGIIFLHFFAKFLQNIFKRNFAKKAENFRVFRERTKYETMQNIHRKFRKVVFETLFVFSNIFHF